MTGNPVHLFVFPGRAMTHRACHSVAEGLLERAGITDEFERLMSVADGPAWKPAAGSYRRALEVCGVRADQAMLVAVHPWDIGGRRTSWHAHRIVAARGRGLTVVLSCPRGRGG